MTHDELGPQATTERPDVLHEPTGAADGAPHDSTRSHLVVAAHGTRDADGEADAHEFVARLSRLLPDVDVRVGFIELSNPPLDVAVEAAGAATAQAGDDAVTVLPLMLARGGHAKDDIPDAIEAGARTFPQLTWEYARVLGPDAALVDALRERVDAARHDTPASETAVLLVGRGCSDAEANATLATTARLLYERGGYGMVETAYIAVASPDIAAGMDRLARLGARRVVAVPYVLFRGLMLGSVQGEVAAWLDAHPGVFDRVDVATTLGDSDAVLELAARRYREGGGRPPARRPMDAAEVPAASESRTLTGRDEIRAERPRHEDVGTPAPAQLPARGGDVHIGRLTDLPFVPYPSGLRLQGRRVVVVGGGCVAQRRVDGLLTAGADITVVAPHAAARVEARAQAGEIRWERRRFCPSDLNDTWYVVACADDTAVNELVGQCAQERRIFCVRADDGAKASAWTPAVGHHEDVVVAVLSNRRPHQSRAIRDQVVAAMQDGRLTTPVSAPEQESGPALTPRA